MSGAAPHPTAQRNAELAAHLVGGLVARGVGRFVVSPGSRSTPLVLALEAARAARPDLEVRVVLDERAAGFVALGMARQAGAPVAVVCTSGSAGAHYLPAAIEARYGGAPLILITADRPLELHGCGANQTIDQLQLFAAAGAPSFDVDAGAEEMALSAVAARLAARAVDAALGGPPGPVHLNVRLREPLWQPGCRYAAPELGRGGGVARGRPRLEAAQLQALLARLGRAERGVIVLGPDPLGDAGAAGAALALGRHLGWPVLADPASAGRGVTPAPALVTTYDAVLRDPELAAALGPDLVLRFGPAPSSKALATWLAAHAAGRTQVVDAGGRWLDPLGGADGVWAADPAELCAAVQAAMPPGDPGWLGRWQAVEAAADAALAAACNDGVWEGAVARAVAGALPAGAVLHVGNSLPVRDLETFGGRLAPGVHVASSRGASGIDGAFATAAGAALAAGAPVVLVCGELTAQHDLGGLAAAVELEAPVAAVVLHNGGGGIFRQLPIAAHPTAFAPFFLTPSRLELGAVAPALGAAYAAASDVAGLRRALTDWRAAPGVKVIEVRIDPEEDARRRGAALAAAAHAARGALGGGA